MKTRQQLLKEKMKHKFHRHTKYPFSLPTLSGVGLTVDDTFYLTEEFLKDTGEVVGNAVFGYDKKKSDKENALYQNMKWFTSKTHHTHSGFQKTLQFENKFNKKAFLDLPLNKIKTKIKRFE